MLIKPARAVDSAVVYKAVNLLNGHSYIGFTSQGLPRREFQHRRDARCKNRGFRFQAAMRKYGDDNFVFEVMADFEGDEDMARLYEVEAIAKYKPEYNLSHGGDGGSLHPETRAKISASHMGRVGSHLGKKFSAETRQRMSLAMKGKPHPNAQGKKRDPAVVERLRAAQMGHVLSEETKAKISAAHTKRWAGMSPEELRELKAAAAVSARKADNTKPVICVTDGKVFPSSKAAAAFYGVKASGISGVLNGYYKSTKGLVFKRLESSAE